MEYRIFEDLARWLLELESLQGTVEIDTGIYFHADMDAPEGKTYDDRDIKILGKSGETISLKALAALMKEIAEDLELCEQERTFFYEGLSKSGDRSYSIIWGS